MLRHVPNQNQLCTEFMSNWRIILIVFMGVILVACDKSTVEREGLSPGELHEWNDRNFKIIGVGLTTTQTTVCEVAPARLVGHLRRYLMSMCKYPGS
jgi:hypothetical protein